MINNYNLNINTQKSRKIVNLIIILMILNNKINKNSLKIIINFMMIIQNINNKKMKIMLRIILKSNNYLKPKVFLS